jgi:hypothetical protein
MADPIAHDRPLAHAARDHSRPYVRAVRHGRPFGPDPFADEKKVDIAPVVDEKKADAKEAKEPGRQEKLLLDAKLPSDWITWTSAEVCAWLRQDDDLSEVFEKHFIMFQTKGFDGRMLAEISEDRLEEWLHSGTDARVLLLARNRLPERPRGSATACALCDKWEATHRCGPCGHVMICQDCSEKADRAWARGDKAFKCPTVGCEEFIAYGVESY